MPIAARPRFRHFGQFHPVGGWSLALLLAALAPAAAGENWAVSREPAPPPPLLERVVHVDFWDKPLTEAMAQLARRAEITVGVHPRFIPPQELSDRRVFVGAGRVSVREAAEMLARALGARYRLVDGHTLVFGGGYEWLREPGRQFYIPVDALVHHAEGGAGLAARLGELAKPLPLIEERNVYMRVEEQPRAGNQFGYQLAGFLPETLAAYVADAVRALHGPGVDPARAPRPADRAAGLDRADAMLRTRVLASYHDRPAREVLADLSLQCGGLRLGFDAGVFADRPLPPVTLDLGDTTLREAVAAFGRALGFSGQTLCPPDLIWLTVDGPEWAVDLRGRETLWEGMEIVGYDARLFVEKLARPDDVVDRLWRQAAPGLWEDPVPALVLGRGTGVLVAVAPEWAQREIAAELAALAADLAAGRWTDMPRP